MKYLDIVENFRNKLMRSTELSPHSVNTYTKLIKELVAKHGIDPTIEELNKFIAYKNNKRQPHIKYALKHYLKFRWRYNTYGHLIKVSVKCKKVKANFVTKKQALEIINAIEKPVYSTIAKIEYFTGTRPSETISIRKDMVFHEHESNRVRIDMASGSIYIDDAIWPELQPYMLNDGAFLFLTKCNGELDKYDLNKKIMYVYNRYYESLKEAARDCGLELSPHDWRRSFAQSLKKEGFGIEEIKKALRHKKIETTRRYLDSEQESVAKTMLKHQHHAI